MLDADLLLSTFHENTAVARTMYGDFMSQGISSELQLSQEVSPTLLSSPTTTRLSLSAGVEESSLALPIELILNSAATQGDLPPDVLRGGSRVPRVVRVRHRFIAEAFQKGHSPTAIARHLGLTVSSVTRALKKVE